MFIPHRHRRQAVQKMFFMLGACFLLLISLLFYNYSSSPAPSNPSLTPQEVVAQFYQYEQSGDFGSSWELFHSLMQEKFSKEDYIQRRAHVFMEDFGVNTFDFELGDSTVESSWKMSPLAPVLADVTRIPVTLVYHSEFGDLKIYQEVYVVKEKEQYRLLWPFSRQK